MFSNALKSFSSNISSNYSWAPQPTSTAGPWKIYDAKKKGTGKAASVFIFDKKSLDPSSSGFGARASDRSVKGAQAEIVERLKKEASSLARLRHPSILELAEPVEETSKGGLMFATEPVTASLAGLLEEKDTQEKGGGVGGRSSRYVIEEADGTKRRRELEIDELEIQKGLLQIAKGLEFLHESASLVHCNLTPEAIFVNAKGDWKISGLGFSSPPQNSNAASSVTPIALSEVLNYDARLPRSVQLNLDYTSPDFVLDSNVSSAADIFSLGLIVIALYNSPHQSPLETNSSTSTYKRLFNSPSSIPTQNNNFLSSQPLPKDVSGTLLPRLITRRPAQRLSAREFQQSEYFDNILVSTIRFLEALPAKTPNEKSQFLRGLSRILNQFPRSVLEKKLMPALLDEMKDRELLALILQNIFKMIEMMPAGKRAFVDQVIPKLRETFITSAKKPANPTERDSLKEAGLMVVLENMRVIADNTTGGEFKDDILPIIGVAMDSPTHSLVDASLQTLPHLLPVLDFTTIKNELFPVIASVFSKTSSMGIKIRGLEAFQVLCGGTPNIADSGDDFSGLGQEKRTAKQPNSAILDKYTVQEKVVPLLKAIKTKEPAVMMAGLEVFKEIGKIADSDFLALEVLPILWSFSLGPLLNLQQFQAFMTLIKSLSARIEQEQTRKLQELSASNATPAAGRNDFMSFGAVDGTDGSATNGDDGDFESLVTGRNAKSPSSNMLDDQWGSNSTPTIASHSTTLPSRPSIGRNRSAQQNPPATFSWSTPAPAPVVRNQSLQPAPPASRTITPDNSLSSFAALQPNAGTSYTQPLQPSRPNAPSSGPGLGMSVLSPTSPSSIASQKTGSSIDWSRANTSSASSSQANPWSSNTTISPPQTQPQSSAFSNFSIAPPPQSPFSGFSIAPPPGTNRGIGTSGTQQSHSQAQPKTGTMGSMGTGRMNSGSSGLSGSTMGGMGGMSSSSSSNSRMMGMGMDSVLQPQRAGNSPGGFGQLGQTQGQGQGQGQAQQKTGLDQYESLL